MSHLTSHCLHRTHHAPAYRPSHATPCSCTAGTNPPAPAGCQGTQQNNTITADWRLPQGNQNRPYKTLLLNTSADCCALCDSDEKCRAWTWQPSNTVCHLASGGVTQPMRDSISSTAHTVPPPAPAPLKFNVKVVYTITPNRLVLEKHIELSVPSATATGAAMPGAPPAFTVLSVRLFDGTTPTVGGDPSVYSGPTVATNTFAWDKVGQKFGQYANIAAFWRRRTDGLFASVTNPFGNYTQLVSSNSSGAGIFAHFEPDFLFKPGFGDALSVYRTEPVVLGVTMLEPYWLEQTGPEPHMSAAEATATAAAVGTLPPAPPAPACNADTISHLMDTTGTYLPNMPITGLADAAACQAACCKASACNVFTFAKKKTNNAPTVCYLKASGALHTTPNCDANGPFDCYSGASPCNVANRAAADMAGGDSKAFQPSSPSEESCISACCADATCLGYVYAPATPAAMGNCTLKQPCCFLKSTLTKQTANGALISATIAGRHKPPRPGPPPPGPPAPPRAPTNTSINMGEWRALTTAIGTFLLDGNVVDRKPVRVQVGWDTNDYQMDVANASDWAEYKRLLTVASQMGVTHTTFAPRNTKQSLRANCTDAWQWEETLWLSMGEKIRQQRWLPLRDPVPQDIQEFVAFGKSVGIQYLAYAYPTLPFEGDGAEPANGDGWLYDASFHPTPQQMSSNRKASLADPEYQDYFAKLLIDFLTATGAAGYAWDYGISGDWRQPSTYAEWQGWMKVLARLRAAHPDCVMDHRQTAHRWGPWYMLAGSYVEPISGDENPESYGAAGQGAVPTLSTDHVLADNMRRINMQYRAQQFQPNQRVPGFMFHQTERSTNGDPSGMHGAPPSLVWNHSLHTRDFDMLGYKYSVVSSVATAGLNNVLAMLPGRNEEDFNHFPKANKDFINRWLDWCDTNYLALARTQPLPMLGTEGGGGANGLMPGLDKVDGVSSFNDDGETGFIFLFNPGPTEPVATLTADQGLGLSPATATRRSWLVTEIYPREAINGSTTPLAIWTEGDSQTFAVPPNQARGLQLSTMPAALPVVLGTTYTTATFVNDRLTLSGLNGLAGTIVNVVAVVPAAAGTTISGSIDTVSAGAFEHGTDSATVADCDECSHWTGSDSCGCASFSISFSGDYLAEMMPVADNEVPSAFAGGWFNSTFKVPSNMWSQREARQAAFDVQWQPEDMNAAWLGNRLLVYPFIMQPDNNTIPRIFINDKEVAMAPSYNSRGHIFQKCFMGFYWNATSFVEANAHSSADQTFALWVPPLNTTGGQKLLGVYWYGTENEYSSNASFSL